MRRSRDELGIALRTEVQLVGDFGVPPQGSEEPQGGAPVDRPEEGG
jgi:hypothetical protein